MFPFQTALNASTLAPFQLGVKEQIEVAAAAGYEGIELWVKDIDAYLESGGTLSELRAFVRDTGITVANAIAFWTWADEDAGRRAEGLEQAKREMAMLAEIDCLAAAAPPYGQVEAVSLDDMAGEYARLIQEGRKLGVEPYLEFWGRSKRLSRLSEAVYVAQESRMEGAKLLVDPYHMYTGGSTLEGLGMLSGTAIGIVHANDYPTSPAREAIQDSDRVFPGEGIARSQLLAQTLYAIGYRGYLSLELFIPNYGPLTALDVAKRGLASLHTTYSISSLST
ncbi:sugar phosphate isomerase/epimerase family protein [Paenibacillus sp. GCM10023252]|uniref:sugar phosphate isomerase/epimerase family protein n=1 Tax=Paenibacillus sp. GCM10023252 TaxID=3252649 RepID=UPI00361FD848